MGWFLGSVQQLFEETSEKSADPADSKGGRVREESASSKFRDFSFEIFEKLTDRAARGRTEARARFERPKLVSWS